MKLSLSKLSKMADTAKPLSERGKSGPEGKWPPLYPVFTKLRKNGFTIKQSVEWLIANGAIIAKERKNAECGLPMCQTRANRKAKK